MHCIRRKKIRVWRIFFLDFLFVVCVCTLNDGDSEAIPSIPNAYGISFAGKILLKNEKKTLAMLIVWAGNVTIFVVRALFHSVAFGRQIPYSVRRLSHFLYFSTTIALKYFELFILRTNSFSCSRRESPIFHLTFII